MATDGKKPTTNERKSNPSTRPPKAGKADAKQQQPPAAPKKEQPKETEPSKGSNRGSKPAGNKATGSEPTPPAKARGTSPPKPAGAKNKGRDAKAEGEEVVTDTSTLAPRLRYKLDCRINDSNGDASLKMEFPGVEKPEVTILGINEHTVLHNTRKFLEQDLFHALHLMKAQSVIDVGGAVTRAAKVAKAYKIKYRSCNPVLDTADVTRVAKYNQAAPEMVCAHTIQQCNCPGADTMMWVHSLYYFTPEEVCEALMKTSTRTGFAMVHRFHGVAGNLPPTGKPEARWTRNDDRVQMHVNGNCFVYEHSALDWLDNTGYHRATIENGEQTLAWELLKSARGTDLYKLVLTNGEIPLAPANLNVLQSLPESALTMMQIRSYSQERWYTVLERSNGEPWTIHNGMYQRLRLAGAGKVPNKNSYQVLMDTARKMKELNVDPDVMVRTVTVAFVHNASDLNTAQGAMVVVRDMLEGVGYLSYVRGWWPTISDLISHYSNVIISWVSFLLVMLIGLALAPLTSNTPRRFTRKTLTAIHRCLRPGQRELDDEEKQIYEKIPKWANDPEMVRKEWEKARELNEIKIIENPRPSPPTSKDDHARRKYQDELAASSSKWYKKDIEISENYKPGMAPQPFIITANVGYANTPSSTSDANKISALHHRLMSGLEHSNAAQVDAMDEATRVMDELGITPDPRTCAEYLKEQPILDMERFVEEEYGGRTHPGKKKKMLEAIEKVRSGRYKDEFYVEWFVKGENAPAKQDGNKCRGIFVPVDTWSCRTAPTLFRLSKLLFSHTQRDDSFITITAGLMAPRLGQWMDRTVEFFGVKYFIMEVDISAYEANQTFEQNANRFKQYYKWLESLPRSETAEFKKLMDKSNKVEFRETIHRATDRVSWGRVAQRDGAMPSGVPDVTLRNSANSIMALIGLLIFVGVDVQKIPEMVRALILGDDNFSCIDTKVRHLFTEERVTLYYKRLMGWDVKVRFFDSDQLSEAEFCSCYFANVDGKHLITPKIGRIFSKTFYMDHAMPKKTTVLFGMLLGLGHFETGYTFSRCVDVLVQACEASGVARPTEELMHDFMWHPHIGTGKVKLSPTSAIEADCQRYGVGERDIKGFLDWFTFHVRSSRFPLKPLILPAGQPTLTRFIATDLPFTLDDVTGQRVDLSLPGRNGQVLLPTADGKSLLPHSGVLDIATDVPGEM
jgi:hypothetical protein